MKRIYGNSEIFAIFLLLVSILKLHLGDADNKEEFQSDNHKGCAYMHCESGEFCVNRKFRCKKPPCPSMLYCAKSRTELLSGPSTCDSVRCNRGHVCVLMVHRCRWDQKCEQQVVRCVSKEEYHEGPASCAGFKCAAGFHCILRESLCMNPPCRLLKSCIKNRDVQIWFGKCRSLGCLSEYDCFLRRPDINCSKPPCKHEPDCVTTSEEEIMNEHCRGWICPRMQTCSSRIVDPCQGEFCEAKRFCVETEVNYSLPWFNDENAIEKTYAQNENELILRGRGRENFEIFPTRSESGAKVSSKKTGRYFNEIATKNISHSYEEDWRKSGSSRMNRPKSNAMEALLKNPKSRKYFEQFQDCLRAVKDMCDSGNGKSQLDGIRKIAGSRGEKFCELLRGQSIAELFHVDTDKSPAKPVKPIFSEDQREKSRIDRPQITPGNRYPDHDTLTLRNPEWSFDKNKSPKQNDYFLQKPIDGVEDLENPMEIIKIHKTPSIEPPMEYFDDGSQDWMEELIKSLVFPSTEKEYNFQENPSKESRQGDSPVFSRYEDVAQDYEWNPSTENLKGTTKKYESSPETFPDYDADRNPASDNGSILRLKDTVDDNNNLEAFVELNKEYILSYIKTLIETMDQNFSNDTELASSESNLKKSIAYSNYTRENSRELQSFIDKRKNISRNGSSTNKKNIPFDFESISTPRVVEEKILIGHPNKEEVSRLSGSIHGGEQSTGRNFYKRLSYGAANDGYYDDKER